jgi:hypothetical protein
MNKGERDAMRIQAIALAQLVGQRAAARQLGVNEDTLCGWVFRFQKVNGKLPHITQTARPMQGNPTSDIVMQALNDAINARGHATRLQLAIAADNASAEFAAMPPKALIDRDTAQALESTSRTGDRTHGWSAERAKAPVVQIANITVPTPDQMQADKDTDAKLDRITALLQSKDQS